jgi:hypothetical protein
VKTVSAYRQGEVTVPLSQSRAADAVARDRAESKRIGSCAFGEINSVTVRDEINHIEVNSGRKLLGDPLAVPRALSPGVNTVTRWVRCPAY